MLFLNKFDLGMMIVSVFYSIVLCVVFVGIVLTSFPLLCALVSSTADLGGVNPHQVEDPATGTDRRYIYSACMYIVVASVIFICWVQSMDLCNPRIVLRKPWISTYTIHGSHVSIKKAQSTNSWTNQSKDKLQVSGIALAS